MKYAAVLLVLICAACAPYMGDPYQQRAAGQAAIDATQAAQAGQELRATMAAKQLHDAKDATQAALAFEAQRTSFALDVERANAERTQQAAQTTQTAIVEGTWTAAEVSAQATQVAGAARATEASYQATGTAIALAIVTEKEINETKAQVAVYQAWLPVCGLMAALIVAILASAAIIWARYQAHDRRSRVIEGNPGARAVIFLEDPNTGGYYVKAIGPGADPVQARNMRPPTITRGSGEPILSQGGVSIEYPVKLPAQLPAVTTSTAHIRIKAVGLIRAAIAVYGPEGVDVPGWRELNGWTSERWQYATSPLKQAGELVTSNQGTRVNSNLGDVLYRLETGAIKFAPSPTDVSD